MTPKETKFKVGDRVKLLENLGSTIEKGSFGTVKRVSSSNDIIWVKWDNYDYNEYSVMTYKIKKVDDTPKKEIQKVKSWGF